MTIELRDDQIESLPAGEDLDWLIFRYVLSPNEYDSDDETRWARRRNYNDDWRGFSTNDCKALIVVDKLKENPEWDYFTLGTDDGEGWHCRTHPIRTASTLNASGETRALAVCRAALMWAKRRREHAQG